MAITRNELVTRSKVLADMKSTDFLEDAEWYDLVNDAVRDLYATVIAVNRDFRVSTSNFSLTSTNTQALPADFRDVRAVIYSPDTESEQYLRRYGPQTAQARLERSYRLQGSSLIIEPRASCAGSYRLLYNPTAPVFTSNTSLDVELEQFQEYIALHAAIKALESDESDISAKAVLFGVQKSMVEKWAASQRSADPDVVVDVRRRRGPRWGWG